MRRHSLFGVILSASVCQAAFGFAPAWAQSNPSADQIINALKPTTHSLHGPTRGIRPVTPAPEPAAPPATHEATAAAPAPAAPAPTAPATEAAAKPPSINLTVQFRTGSAELTPAAVATLTELGHALSSDALAPYRFRIAGYTDTVGTAALNKKLSEERAASVADYLEKNFSIDPQRLDVAGFGETHLLVQTPPQTAEPRNRRVQVVNLGA